MSTPAPTRTALRALGLAVAVSAAAAVPSAAATTTYEAEAFLAGATSTHKSVITLAGASGGKAVRLGTKGELTFKVPTAVKKFSVYVRSESCSNGKESSAKYTVAGKPSYWQEDPFFETAQLVAPAKLGLGLVADITKIYPGGWSGVSEWLNTDPSEITVKFVNDYSIKLGPFVLCDRNLVIDSLVVES